MDRKLIRTYCIWEDFNVRGKKGEVYFSMQQNKRDG
jgi:hypothetical protein